MGYPIMVTKFGRVLRLAFDRGDAPSPEPEVAETSTIEFSAFAEDCRLYGRLAMDGDRLTDMLNDHDEIVLVDVRIEAIADGTIHEVEEFTVSRDEILVVEAAEARGDPTRRTHTQPTPIIARLGPYEVRGFVHLKPGTDALEAIHRRKAMVPLTDASISYDINGVMTHRRAKTVIFNRELVDNITVIDTKLVGSAGVAPAAGHEGATAGAGQEGAVAGAAVAGAAVPDATPGAEAG